MILKEITDELKKELEIAPDGHILFSGYNHKLLKDCKSEILKENFKKWKNQKYFLQGIYNLSRFFDENISIEDFKEYIKKIEKIKNKSYFIPNEKYYAIYVDTNNIWDFHTNSFMKNEKVALSKLKEYEMERPNMIVWNLDILGEKIDDETMDYLRNNKLIIEPTEEEKEILE